MICWRCGKEETTGHFNGNGCDPQNIHEFAFTDNLFCWKTIVKTPDGLMLKNDNGMWVKINE